MWQRVLYFLAMMVCVTNVASQVMKVDPTTDLTTSSPGLLRTPFKSQEGDGNTNACLGSQFPCNVTSEFCCFFMVETGSNEDEAGADITDLAWCCSFDDGCGEYPYTCGEDSDVGPSLNVTSHPTQENGSRPTYVL